MGAFLILMGCAIISIGFGVVIAEWTFDIMSDYADLVGVY